jgi:hypothetical protein
VIFAATGLLPSPWPASHQTRGSPGTYQGSRHGHRWWRHNGSMPTHIALLRGINLGGRNKVAMADLRALVSGLGHADVTTYIQSGNVLFTPAPGADEAALAQEMTAARRDRPGHRRHPRGAGPHHRRHAVPG